MLRRGNITLKGQKMALRLVYKKQRVLEKALHILVAGTDLVRAGERKMHRKYFFKPLSPCGRRGSSQVLMKQLTKTEIEILLSQMKATTRNLY